ncbi:MAG: GntR family transcriptional regulator [Candidatus Methylacidiphilales bacterium]|nr:GntR family transcriptional regulator [Candidatus Methylacidiphilales bacterium]
MKIETRSVHEQLIQLCLKDLAAGRWQAGERFPSERELVALHGVSRATANKVLVKLVSEGWLEMRKGIGCFVAERPTLFASLRRIESFTDFATEQGYRPSTQVLDFQSGHEPQERIRSALRVGPLERVIFVRRLRLIDGDPVILEDRWLPAALYPDLNEQSLEGSFYQLCRERYGLTVQREEAEVRAALAPAWPGVNWSAPALRLEGMGFDAAGVPLWYQVLHYHGGRFTLSNVVDNAAAMPRLALNFAIKH